MIFHMGSLLMLSCSPPASVPFHHVLSSFRSLPQWLKKHFSLYVLIAGLVVPVCMAQTQLYVTVLEEKSWSPVTDLRPGEFRIEDDDVLRTVADAVYEETELMDIVLLVDSSVLGEAVQSLARSLVAQLRPKEQMAIVAYHNSADLVQDFTNSKELLLRALAGLRFGNAPQALDALYATVLDAFENSTFRKVILLVSSGVVAYGRIRARQVIRAARQNDVSIYPVYTSTRARSLFRELAEKTGAAHFNARDLSRKLKGNLASHIFDIVRHRYRLTLQGQPLLSERLKVRVRRKGDYFVSVQPAY